MKSSLVVLTVAMLAVSFSAFAEEATGHARPHQIDQSGIQAKIFFVDNGSTLWVLGVAEGLDPTKSYISLVYGDGSLPGGPHACEPSATHPITGAQMFVGNWKVDPDGTGVLVAMKTGASYVPVRNAGTISVRLIVPIGLPVLRACGEIAVNPF
jgi:hypothetical protein